VVYCGLFLEEINYLKHESGIPSENKAAAANLPVTTEAEPDRLPQDNLRNFLIKWGTRFAAQLKTTASPGPPLPDPPEAKAFLFSTRVVKIINYLNQPLFWLGVCFLGWLIGELLLPGGYRAALAKYRPLITISGAVAIGYWTNWCAVKMIFYPRVKNAVWWGLIPARRRELTDLITESMVTKLVSPEIVQAYLTKDNLLQDLMLRCTTALAALVGEGDFRREFKQLLARYLQQRLQEPQLAAHINGLIQSRIGGSDSDSIKTKVFTWTKPLWGPVIQAEINRMLENPEELTGQLVDGVDAWLDGLPVTLERQAASAEAAIRNLIITGLQNLNLKAIIKGQLEQMDESQFEKILTGNLSPELVFLQVSGGILGGLVGLALFYPLVRVGLLLLVFGLWVVYRVTRKEG
jgi:uncharacterized membrane protein YheB (UPF0754 family)